jgi:beta-fructofuranosidase
MFALPDKWVWDFWFAEDGGDHQLLYLQAPRALGDPELRHHHATIGHAVSADFASWQLLPDALAPGDPGSWDDLAVWTGSAITHAGAWSMLYTGVSRSEGGLGQRIGLAT